MNKRYILSICLSVFLGITVQAQIGQHRDNFSMGVNGGYILSKVSFDPSVTQSQHGGISGGLSFRYVCEKYFSTVCSIYGEINYANVGWKEKIQDTNNQPVINSISGEAENYSRNITYIQIPVMAHLAWGKENKGVNFFVNAGPQFGVYLSDNSKSNFTLSNANMKDRANAIVAQDTMSIAHKFDYGIAAGVGMEYSCPKVGHFMAEARYYYGLGNLYGSSKKDYFGMSRFGQIVFKITYLFDITNTNKHK